jgi:TorA maturation chaperone TorD
MEHMTTTDSTDWTTVHTARLDLCHFLALVASDPRSERWERLEQDDVLSAAASAATFLAQEPTATPPALAPGESAPATLDLRPIVDALRSPRADLIAEFDSVFGLTASKECPTYETDYCAQTFSVYRSQQLADIAGYYSAFGLQPSRDAPERADHVSLEIEFLAWLLAKERHALRPDNPDAAEQVEVCRRAQKGFVETHLAWWLPAFAHALKKKTDRSADAASGYLGALAGVLAAWIPIERAVLGVEQPTELMAPNPTEQDELSCENCGGDAQEVARS